MTELVTLSPESIEAIARRVVELQSVAQARSEHTLTRAEAVVFSGRRSVSAFDRWAAKWGVKSCSPGHYSRHALELAKEREAGIAKTPATLRRQWKEAA